MPLLHLHIYCMKMTIIGTELKDNNFNVIIKLYINFVDFNQIIHVLFYLRKHMPALHLQLQNVCENVSGGTYLKKIYFYNLIENNVLPLAGRLYQRCAIIAFT